MQGRQERGIRRDAFSLLYMKKGFLFTMMILLSAAVMFPVSAYYSSSGWELIISSQETDKVYKSQEAEPGDELVLSWIHSVEKSPWAELYKVTEEGSLLLDETVFQSFGAGVPHQKGDMSVENGEVVIRNINEEHEALRWIHSQNVEFTLYLNGKEVFDAEELPHHEKMEMKIEKR
ncbi:DUF1850 domain-containing protein [Thalassorhabdus alkalitolerans]